MTTVDERAVADARYAAGDYDGVLERMDSSGDAKIMWNKDNPDEVEIARATFQMAVDRRSLIFKAVGKDGAQGERVTEFNPELERVIIVPQLVGG